jgi:hypothetical protein
MFPTLLHGSLTDIVAVKSVLKALGPDVIEHARVWHERLVEKFGLTETPVVDGEPNNIKNYAKILVQCTCLSLGFKSVGCREDRAHRLVHKNGRPLYVQDIYKAYVDWVPTSAEIADLEVKCLVQLQWRLVEESPAVRSIDDGEKMETDFFTATSTS